MNRCANSPFLYQFLRHTAIESQRPGDGQFLSRAIKATTEAEVKKILIEANEYVARQHFAISLMNPVKYSIASRGSRLFRPVRFDFTQSAKPIVLHLAVLDRPKN